MALFPNQQFESSFVQRFQNYSRQSSICHNKLSDCPWKNDMEISELDGGYVHSTYSTINYSFQNCKKFPLKKCKHKNSNILLGTCWKCKTTNLALLIESDLLQFLTAKRFTSKALSNVWRVKLKFCKNLFCWSINTLIDNLSFWRWSKRIESLMTKIAAFFLLSSL